jgi:hypothetical protein
VSTGIKTRLNPIWLLAGFGLIVAFMGGGKVLQGPSDQVVPKPTVTDNQHWIEFTGKWKPSSFPADTTYSVGPAPIPNHPDHSPMDNRRLPYHGEPASITISVDHGVAGDCQIIVDHQPVGTKRVATNRKYTLITCTYRGGFP